MTWINTWLAQRQFNRINRYEQIEARWRKNISRLCEWITAEKLQLRERTKAMTQEEFDKYALKVGLIDEEDYEIIMRERLAKHTKSCGCCEVMFPKKKLTKTKK